MSGGKRKSSEYIFNKTLMNQWLRMDIRRIYITKQSHAIFHTLSQICIPNIHKWSSSYHKHINGMNTTLLHVTFCCENKNMHNQSPPKNTFDIRYDSYCLLLEGNHYVRVRYWHNSVRKRQHSQFDLLFWYAVALARL